MEKIKKFSIILSISLFVFHLFGIFLVLAHEEVSAVKKMKPMMDETHHLEVKPETLEGYRIPYMKVTVTILDPKTQEKKVIELHPMFGGNFHYGVNVGLKPKQYLLRFHLDIPTFARGDERENLWLQPIEAEFPFDASVKFEKSIKIGSKETKDMKISFEVEHAEPMFILEGTEQEHDMAGMEGLQASTQVLPLVSSISVVFYIALLVVGFVLGIVFSKFTKKSSKK